MSEELPRIAQNFQLRKARLSLILFLYAGAPFLAGWLANGQEEEQRIAPSLLFLWAGASTVGWIVGLVYIFLFLTPKCDSCQVATRKLGRMDREGQRWKMTICPQCREVFRHQDGSDLSG